MSEIYTDMTDLEGLFVRGVIGLVDYTSELNVMTGAMDKTRTQIVNTLPALREFVDLAYGAKAPVRTPFLDPENLYPLPEGKTERQAAAQLELMQWRAGQDEKRKADAEANYGYTAKGQEELRTKFAMSLHEKQAEEDRRLGEQTAKKAQAEWEAAAAKAAAKWEATISAIPGLFGTSSVTAEQMAAAEAGVPQRFADSWLRELKDEVYNGKDLPNVDIKDAAARLGVDPNANDKAIYAQVEAAWGNSSLFAGGKNLDLLDVGAIEGDIATQAAGESGQQAIKDYLTTLGIAPASSEEETPGAAVLPAPEDMQAQAGDLSAAIKTAFDGDQVRQDFAAVGGAVIGYINAGYRTGALEADWTGPIVDAVVSQLAGQLATMLGEDAPPP